MSFIYEYDFLKLERLLVETHETTQGEMVLNSVVANVMHLIERMIYPSADTKVKYSVFIIA